MGLAVTIITICRYGGGVAFEMRPFRARGFLLLRFVALAVALPFFKLGEAREG